ncbi:MAG: phenylacetate--CoA ligase family protein [Clostridiales Family XIII bacterium]|nr:phenylacetate--CoA ligase family protein [Clostridiales Family XIII bacterium]
MNLKINEAIRLVSKYDRMKAEERDAVRAGRLRELVMYVKANSPYFSKLYAGIDEGFSLSDLPVTSKLEMMENFDDWVTDRDVHLEDIYKFMEDKDNIGRMHLGKYVVNTTSGSTGNPAVILYDENVISVLNGTDFNRGMAWKWDAVRFLARKAKSAGLYTKGGFYMGSGMLRYRQLTYPKQNSILHCQDLMDPMPKIVEGLNAFDPALLGSYPTMLTLLADEKIAGRLRISPVIICTSGEKLMEDAREYIEGAFGCHLQDNYYCTEGGTLASGCKHKRLHVNDDWIIIEPVDSANRPVPNGQRADKWLMTSLGSFVQPLIRYEVTDRIVMHDEGCPCGKLSPWLEIEGRTDETVVLEGEDGDVKLLPAVLYTVMSKVHRIKRFQLVVHKKEWIEMRLEADDREAAFAEASAVLQELFDERGTHARLTLSDMAPQPDPSGKFKRYYKAD